MKIAVYSPYLDTAGGGEKYILTIAEILSKKEQVDVLIDKNLGNIGIDQILEKNNTLHRLDLSKVSFIKAPVGIGSSFGKRLVFLRRYDWLFYLTDGSIFYSTAKNSIIHFQVPFENTEARGKWGKIKLSTWKKAIYNSFFTKEIVEKSWPIKGTVVYPPVSTELFKPLKKRKQILSVGRFFGYLKDKKHQILIEAFKNLTENQEVAGWSLHLAGGASEGDQQYIDQLKSSSVNYPVNFYPNADLKELIKLYGESSIYWHASGFGEDDPKRFEHFGITTVEAMSAGCVPVVIKKGGQIEIVQENKCGLFWDTIDQLQQKTLQLIKSPDSLNKLSAEAIKRSKKFSKEEFQKNILSLVYEK